MERSITHVLPTDHDGHFIGRVWDPVRHAPVPVLYREGKIWDASTLATSTADLFDHDGLVEELIALQQTPPSWDAEVLTLEGNPSEDAPQLLAPIDFQVIKACGVTFVGSMIERVIEERSGGDPLEASRIREAMQKEVGFDLSSITPGSQEASTVKTALLERGWWSQYLEVGLGPDPEVFTKGPVLSAVGSGSFIGIPTFSTWNNPEPELVLVMNSDGRPVGATLGNDVNLRDVEGRSALLLGMAKDNNRSTAIGPFVRIFDEGFSLDDARTLDITLVVDGPEGFRLTGLNSVSALSRSFEQLIDAAFGPHHQYPDGFALFTGTLFAPSEDRDNPGEGFTHKSGDVVEIANPRLGSLVNEVGVCEDLEPWTYGIRDQIRDMQRLSSK